MEEAEAVEEVEAVRKKQRENRQRELDNVKKEHEDEDKVFQQQLLKQVEKLEINTPEKKINK